MKTSVKIFSCNCYLELQVLKSWDIKEQVCLQTIPVRFPFGHRIPEHGPFPFLVVTSPINSLFIGRNDCLAEVKIVAMSANKCSKTTHWRPLCAALYNPSMGQVITGCEGSVITFWDLSTGRRAQQIAEAHGAEEISCMTMDPSGRRLMTGDRSGNIHVSYRSLVGESLLTSLFSFLLINIRLFAHHARHELTQRFKALVKLSDW